MKANDEKDCIESADLAEARRGFRLMLRRKGLSRRWIAEHAEELLAQACAEYSAKPVGVRLPAAWIVNGAWWRAQDLLRREDREPRCAGLETVLHVADESTPTPEQQTLQDDEQARLREALGRLPDKECRMLALVYFEGDTVVGAGRKLGWTKSTADRRHSAALAKLRAFLEEPTLHSPPIFGPAAWVLAEVEGRGLLAGLGFALDPARALAALGAEAAEAAGERLGELWRRILPFADPAAAASAGGGGRALGACGVAAASVLCIAAGAAPVLRDAPPRSAPPPAKAEKAAIEVENPLPPPPTTDAPAAEAPPARARMSSSPVERAREKPERRRPKETAASTPAARVVNEFGVEASPGSTTATPAPAPAPETTSSSRSTPAPLSRATPKPEASPNASSEFGL